MLLRSITTALVLLISGTAQTPTVPITGPAGAYTSTQTHSTSGPVTLPSPWSGPAGVYQVTLPPGSTVVQTETSITITWGNGPPPPPPPPPIPLPPGPTPLLPVTPMSASLHVVAVYDRAGPTPIATQVALQTSKTIAAALKPLNAELVCVDVTTPTVQSWIKDAKAAGVPALIVIVLGANNKAVNFEALPLPIDETAVLAEIKRIRGLSDAGVTPSPQMTRVVQLLTEIQTTLGRHR